MSARSERRFYKEGSSQHFIEFRYDMNDKNQDISASLKEYLPMDVNEIYLRRDKDRLRQLSKVYDRFLLATLSDVEKQSAREFYDSYQKMQHYMKPDAQLTNDHYQQIREDITGFLRKLFHNLDNFDYAELFPTSFSPASIQDQFIKTRLEYLHQEILTYFADPLRFIRIAYAVIYPQLKANEVDAPIVEGLRSSATKFAPNYMSHYSESIAKLSYSIDDQIHVLQDMHSFFSPFFPNRKFLREPFLKFYENTAEEIFGSIQLQPISSCLSPIQQLTYKTCILNSMCRIIASQKLDEWVTIIDKEISQLESFWK